MGPGPKLEFKPDEQGLQHELKINVEHGNRPHFPHVHNILRTKIGLGMLATAAAALGLAAAEHKIGEVEHDIGHFITNVEHHALGETVKTDVKSLTMTPPVPPKQFILSHSYSKVDYSAGGKVRVPIIHKSIPFTTHGVEVYEKGMVQDVVNSRNGLPGLQFKLVPLQSNAEKTNENNTSEYAVDVELDLDNISVQDPNVKCQSVDDYEAEQNELNRTNNPLTKGSLGEECYIHVVTPRLSEALSYAPFAFTGGAKDLSLIRFAKVGGAAVASNFITNLLGESPQEVALETESEDTVADETMNKYCGENLLEYNYLKADSLAFAKVWLDGYIQTAKSGGDTRTVTQYTNAMKNMKFSLLNSNGTRSTYADIAARKAKVPLPQNSLINTAYSEGGFNLTSNGETEAPSCSEDYAQ
jgi:hypothetical protein